MERMMREVFSSMDTKGGVLPDTTSPLTLNPQPYPESTSMFRDGIDDPTLTLIA